MVERAEADASPRPGVTVDGRFAASRAALVLLATLVQLACASGGVPSGSIPAAEGTAIRAAAWELPASAIGSRSLYRLHYDGPEGDGLLRVALRIETPYRFQLTGSDRFGNRHWALDVEAGEALWIDDDARIHCRGSASVRLPGWTEGPVRLNALPAILLGALPGGSEGRRSQRRIPSPDGSTRLELEDAAGNRWTAELDGRGEMRSWTLWERGRPTWWWRREQKGGRLSQRDGGRQMTWEQVVTEKLETPLQELDTPADYEPSCEGVDR